MSKLYFYTYTDSDGVRQPSSTTVPDGKYARQVIANAVSGIHPKAKLDNDSLKEVKQLGDLRKLYFDARPKGDERADALADRTIHPEVTRGGTVDPLASIPGDDAPIGAPIPVN